MKKFIFLFFCLVTINAFSQELSWYKMYSGTIDQYPVVLHLHKAGHKFAGYYYYASKEEPIYFRGNDTTEKNKILLTAYITPQKEERFELEQNGSSLSGTWIKEEGSSPLNFTAAEAKAPVAFTYVFNEGSKKLRPKLKDSPEATFQSASVWPAGNSATDIFLKKNIRKSFTTKPGNEEIGALLLKAKKEFFDDYIATYKGEKDSEILENPTLNYSTENQNMVVFQSQKIISLASFTWSYSGGAHGNYGTSNSAYNIVNKKKLTLLDVFTADGKKKLSSFLARAIRAQFNLKATDPLTEAGLFENKISPTDNFYVTHKGIMFTYNPYEIGPYAIGEYNVYVPFSNVQNLLQPAFKKLIQ